MVSVSGVRGILGAGMDPETAARYTAAYASWLGGRHIVVGRDTRASGEGQEHLTLIATSHWRDGLIL